MKGHAAMPSALALEFAPGRDIAIFIGADELVYGAVEYDLERDRALSYWWADPERGIEYDTAAALARCGCMTRHVNGVRVHFDGWPITRAEAIKALIAELRPWMTA